MKWPLLVIVCRVDHLYLGNDCPAPYQRVRRAIGLSAFYYTGAN